MKRAVLITILLIVYSVQHIAFAQNQQLIDSLQKALKTANSDSVKASVLNGLANAYFTYDNDKSIHYAQEAYKVSARAGYKRGMGDAHANIGWVQLNRDNYPEAFKNFREAIKIKNETGDAKETIRCYIALGHAYLGQGNYPEALKNYFEAIRVNEATGTPYGKNDLYPNIAIVYNEEGNYTEALKYYHESILAAEASGRKESLATIYINNANTYLKLKNYGNAQTYNLSALKLSEELGDIQGKAFALSQIGVVYKAQTQYTTALDYLIQSLKIADDNGLKQLQITVLNEIGTVYLFQNKYAEARNYLDKGLAISKEIRSIDNISNCYAHLAQLDSAQGNSTMSLRNYKMHIIYRDSALNLESVRKSEQVRMQFEMDKKEATTKAEQEKKDVLTKAELQKQKLMRNGLIGVFASLFLFAGTGVLYFVKKRERNRVKQLEAVRARISRDLHDDMGSTLQSISVMSEIVRMKSNSDNKQESIPLIEKIGSASREMIDKMNDIVWAVNPKNDHFENIIFHMRSFAGELLAGKDIVLHFKADNELNNVKLSMEKRKSFFLVFKEAVNNAYKYSGAKNVRVEITKTNHQLKLIVEDDGNGFNLNDDRLKMDGNGLKNMKSRAVELNGIISIASETENGTRVSLTVNLS